MRAREAEEEAGDPAAASGSSFLARTGVRLDDPALTPLFETLQGNILKSHGRDNSVHVFVRLIGTPERCRTWLGRFASGITSAAAQAAQSRDHARNGTPHPFVNLMLSASGYDALAVPPDARPRDPAFRAGMKASSSRRDGKADAGGSPVNLLGDRLEDWEPAFRGRIDALLILAYGGVELSADEARAFLDRQVKGLRGGLDGVGEIVHVEHGHVLRDEAGRPIEHFGFVDGISNPLLLEPDLEQARRDDDGCDRHDLSAPLSLVLVPDPGAREAQACGSYLVYRKLQQNIRGFHRRIDELAAALAAAAGGPVDRELAGAYVVGRFRDGTPVVDHPSPAGGPPTSNFNYDDDPAGTRCPFQAHTRKTNPRGDLVRAFASTPEAERASRIVRRAISYGPPDLEPAAEWTDAGLLFLCAVADIGGQFVVQQSGWCNSTGFLREATGLDPVVGCPSGDCPPCPQSWPLRWGQAADAPKLTFDFSGFVRCRGGEYFFAPSLDFLRRL